MPRKRKPVDYSKGINRRQDFYYISTDPAENADNFDKKWAFIKDIKTDEERYEAIRARWGNSDIPDPKVNLTYRHCFQNQCETKGKENCFNPPVNSNSKIPFDNQSRKNRKVSRRRSRSYTRPYEQQISNLKKNYDMEYSWLLNKQLREFEEIQILQYLQTFMCHDMFSFDINGLVNLKLEQKQVVMNLLSNHYSEVQNFIRKKNEDIEACKRYMEEVKSFFNLYQKVNDDTVTVQMTDEQYFHTIETEKMYTLYSKFYGLK